MSFPINIKNYDIVIVGSGGSGLISAISASDNFAKSIAVISKVNPTSSHTVSAKGGINASLSNVIEDNWKWHAFDTIKGSDYLADVDAVEILCKNAESAILDLEKYGVVFSRDENGKIAQRAYGGQTTDYGNGKIAYRACYSKDKTGHTILHTLYQQAIKRNINFFLEFIVLELIIEDNKCFGCIALDLTNGEIIIFKTKIVIIATGGYSQIFQNTTSSSICTGDGLSLVLKEGLPLQDMEFIQFHPTGIYGHGFLITEAARGEGAYLLNADHERFMKRYAPKMIELASRDIISQAMAIEIKEGRGAGIKKDYLYLDMRHLDKDLIATKLPGVVDLIKNFTKLNIQQDLIPVAPSSHYTMGGIPCDLDCLVIDGLMAIGEASCLSVHGANRLGCNSLLDLIVFGKIAGYNAGKIVSNYQVKDKNYNDVIENLVQKKIKRFIDLFDDNNNCLELNSLKKMLKENNENNLGVFRSEDLLKNALSKTLEIFNQFRKYRIKNKNLIWNQEIIEYFELESLLFNSIATNFSAINRRESRGSHYRFDFPQRDDNNFLAHSLVRIVDFNEIKLDFSLKKVKNHSSIKELNLTVQKRNY